MSLDRCVRKDFTCCDHENWMRLVHGICIGAVESLTAATHILFYIHNLYTLLNGSCQTISKIPLDSINQTHLILVVVTPAASPLTCGVLPHTPINHTVFSQGIARECLSKTNRQKDKERQCLLCWHGHL